MFDMTKSILLKYKDCQPNERIYPHSTDTLNRNLRKLLLLNGLPQMTMHELRHTFIPRCHGKNIDEIVVQKWVGHTIGSVMTKKVYTHIISKNEENSIAILNSK
jgi:integrase